MTTGRGQTQQCETPSPYVVHRLVAARAAECPDAVAVVDAEGDLALTYAGLTTAAWSLARRLRDLGVGPDATVGVLLPRSVDAVVALLGVLAAGGAYVPLDPGHPPRRLRATLADAGVALVVGRPDDTGAADLGPDVVVVDVAQGDAPDGLAPEVEVDADNLAYVMYTSGSTGEPKGVAVTHAGVVRLVSDQGYARFGPDRRVLAAAPLAFDASTFEIWGALCHGGTVVVSGARVPVPADLRAAVARHGLTTAWLTASLFNLVVDVDAGALAGLEEVLVGGEALSPRHVRAALDAAPGLRLVNGYGPTECTTFSCCHPVPPDHPADRPVPIGKPIAHTTVRVVGADGGRTPAEAEDEGELLVGGPGLARGYLGRPALTAERFVPDPFAAVPGARLYRTGDLVRSQPDGTLEFLGRLDQQVKLRGFRIEPGEVEAALLAHPRVREAVVVLRQDPPGPRLVAYTVGGVGCDELRAHVREHLPDPMVPAAFVDLDALPLTDSGKLDRRALPEAPGPEPSARAGDGEGDGRGGGGTRPRDDTEAVVLGLFEEVLGLSGLGVEDDFFDVGGTSLLAAQVVARLRDIHLHAIALSDFFEGPTVAKVARAVAAGGRASPLPPLRLHSRLAALPCSFAQERLWFLDQLMPGSAVYNVPVALRLRGRLSPDLLQSCLRELVQRHEGLRTTFALQEGHPVQQVGIGELDFTVTDLRRLPATVALEEAVAVVEEAARRPFDLAVGPLFRVQLVRVADDDQVLLLSVHHVVVDGWSLTVLLRELGLLYRSRASGGPPAALPAPLVGYADFAAWERDAAETPAVQQQLAYWRDHLADVDPVLDLPTDRPRPPSADHAGDVVRFELSSSTQDAVLHLARAEGATPFTVLLASFHLLLHRYTGALDVCVGTPIANRVRADTAHVVGPFLNTLVARATFPEGSTFRHLVRTLHRRLLDAYDNADVPFERLVEELQPVRDPGRMPFVQALFAMPPDLARFLDLGDVRVEPVALHTATAKADLILTIDEGTPRGVLEYATSLFERSTAERMVAHYTALLEQALDAPDRPLGSLPATSSPAEQHAGTTPASPEAPVSDACIHDLVGAQARATPARVAVVHGDLRLTYAEVEHRADRVAARLRALGVGPDVLVGVLLPRSADAVTAVLGVLKAGGAYLPLDPDYPPARLEHMLGDAGTAVLVTRSDLSTTPAVEGRAVVLVDDLPDIDTASPPTPPAHPDNLAYVIYTSGSTGTPKGAGITHGNTVNFFRGVDEVLGPDSGEAWLGSTSISFDMSVLEMLWTLSRGKRVVVHDSLARVAYGTGDAGALAVRPTLARDRVDGVHCTPTMARFLFSDDDLVETLADVGLVLVGGEEVTGELHRLIRARTSARIFNIFGPTECTVWSSACEIEPEPPPRIPIGRALAGQALHIVDRGLGPVLAGVVGEICIGGLGVGRGYLGRPGQTAERFVPDPIAGVPGARMYRTGDLGRVLPDGRVEFLGRVDRQVKVRGYRVELQEVEAVLDAHPAVRRSAVVLRTAPAGGPRLVAHVALEEPQGPPHLASLLRDHVADRLPPYMVPSEVVVVPSFPLTPSGKIDRTTLAVAVAEGEAAGGRRPPGQVRLESRLQGLIVQAWADVLGTDDIDIDTSFFDLGGTSLSLVHVVETLRASLERPPKLVDLFRYPTVRRLSSHLEGVEAGAAP